MFENYLRSLKIGNKILISTAVGNSMQSYAIVRKLTEKEIFIEGNDISYSRKSGKSIGLGSLFSSYIVELNQDIIDELVERNKRKWLIFNLLRYDYEKYKVSELIELSTAELEQITKDNNNEKMDN